MGFWFEFCDIQMNEKSTCHNFHDFKWKNMNIYSLLKKIWGDVTPFLACWIVIAPIPSSSFVTSTRVSCFFEKLGHGTWFLKK
jgi:hypothetical protein